MSVLLPPGSLLFAGGILRKRCVKLSTGSGIIFVVSQSGISRVKYGDVCAPRIGEKPVGVRCIEYFRAAV